MFDDTEFDSFATPNHPKDTLSALRPQLVSIYNGDDNQWHWFQSKAWNPLNLWTLAAESVSADTNTSIFRIPIINECIADITGSFPALHSLSSYVNLVYSIIWCPNTGSLHHLLSFWNDESACTKSICSRIGTVQVVADLIADRMSYISLATDNWKSGNSLCRETTFWCWK